MTETEDRAVTAMRAIGDTVTGAPPLRLPQNAPSTLTRLAGPAGSGWRAWRLWLVPAAAAVAVLAVGISLALRFTPKQSALVPGSSNASVPAGSSGSASVPPYYVTLPASFGWYAYAPPTPSANSKALIIGETVTGKRLATVLPPRGMTFNVVSAAADDRTFVVGATSFGPGTKTVSPYWTDSWFLLRIAPGTAHVAQLTSLPIPSVSYITGVALSPDGTELAVASKQFNILGSSKTVNPPQLSLYSVATGKVLRHWGSESGWITASVPAANSKPNYSDTSGMSTGLRWTPDGGELAFAWNGSEIRLIDLTSPTSSGSDLVKASRLWAGIGATYTPAGSSSTCDAAHGWSLSTGAETFTCAGTYTPMRPATGPGCGKDAPAHPAFFQQIRLGGGAQELTTLAQSPYCTGTGQRTQGAGLGWSSADGSTVIGTLGDGALVQYLKFGVFTKNTFTALPALLSAEPVASVAW